MLVLRNKQQSAIEVPLAPGASIMVRPADTQDVERAGAEVSVLMASLMTGAEAAATFSAWLGDDLRDGDFNDQAWRAAIIKRATLHKLAVQCCEQWTGIGDETGTELPLTPENLALLLRDPVIAKRISDVIERPVHVELAEKNALAASPTGAAVAVEPIAPNASEAASPAPPAESEQPENSVRS